MLRKRDEMEMESVFLWGTGNVARCMLEQYINLDEYKIIGFIDNDERKTGSVMYGYTVYAPEVLYNSQFDKIVIMSDSYLQIKDQIVNMNSDFKNKIENKYFFIKHSLLKRYKESDDSEIRNILHHIEYCGLDVFNYDFIKNYSEKDIEISFDMEANMFYVMHHGKRMYFSRKIKSEEAIRRYYKSILVEQDTESPHRYLQGDIQIHAGDIVVDAGVAEGNFSLDIVDHVKKIYLIEADEDWCEALKLTFKDYLDKVVILNGFLTSYDDGKLMKLDSMIDEPVNFIKMDIEGAEYDALCGAGRLVDLSENLRLAVCSYHSDYDQILIEHFMDEHNIEHDTSAGYMWFPYTVKQTTISTKLVKGVVRGIKR